MVESGAFPVIFLMGPTASGKTDIAVELTRHMPMEIISVDSAMVYRGMDIGTAKPGKEVLEIAPHRLIDICDPAESYSAARFCEDALVEISNIQSANRIPLLVGGTGLYFRSLEHGLSELPPADDGIRKTIEAEARESGWEVMHERLQMVDPGSAKRIHPNDPQRIQRALEVYYLTGKPLSEHFRADRNRKDLPFRPVKFITCPNERDTLHERIEKRYEWMLESGLVAEVERLFQREDLHAGLPAMKMVGYRQIWSYLQGELDYQEMKAQAVYATRQLAKRQLTWLRREENCQWYTGDSAEISGNLLKFLDNLTKNPA